MSRITRDKIVQPGKWRTLETHWSRTKVRFYFRRPSGAKVRVRYGYGWFSKNRQKHTLDGSNVKIISIGSWGLTRAKIQMKSTSEIQVIYEVEVLGP